MPVNKQILLKLLSVNYTHSYYPIRYMKISNECVRTFLDNMRREIGKPFELVEPVSLLALDILMQCAMSAKTNCQNARYSQLSPGSIV